MTNDDDQVFFPRAIIRSEFIVDPNAKTEIIIMTQGNLPATHIDLYIDADDRIRIASDDPATAALIRRWSSMTPVVSGSGVERPGDGSRRESLTLSFNPRPLMPTLGIPHHIQAAIGELWAYAFDAGGNAARARHAAAELMNWLHLQNR